MSTSQTKTTYKSNAVDVSTANAILAAKEIGGPMAESLRQFSTAITLAAQFFSAIAEEVRAYAATADLAAQLKSRSLAEDATWKLHRHYQRMSAPALALERTCAAFLAVVPQIEADLQRLASSDATHIPYIQVRVRFNRG